MRAFITVAALCVLTTACTSDKPPVDADDREEMAGRVTALEDSLDTMQASLSATESSLTDNELALSEMRSSMSEAEFTLSSMQRDLDDLAAAQAALGLSVDSLQDELFEVRGAIDHLESVDYLDLGAELASNTTPLPLRSSFKLRLSKSQLRSIATLRAAAESAIAVGRNPATALQLEETVAALGQADMSSAPVRAYFIAMTSHALEAIARQPEAADQIVEITWTSVPEGTVFGSSSIEDVGRAHALARMFESISRQPEATRLILDAFPFGPITNPRDEHVQLARVTAISALLGAFARQPQADFSDAVALLGGQPIDLDAELRWSHGYAVAAAVSAIARQPSAADMIRGYLSTLLHIHVDED